MIPVPNSRKIKEDYIERVFDFNKSFRYYLTKKEGKKISSHSKGNIQLNVQLTENEYVLSTLYLSKKGILIAYTGLFFILTIAFYLLSFGETEQSSLIMAIVIASITLLLGFYRTVHLYRKKFKKDPLMQEQQVYEIEEKGINIFHLKSAIPLPSLLSGSFLRLLTNKIV